MQKLKLPHKFPIKFAKQVLFRNGDNARVRVEFLDIPSLGMLIESAAQSSAVFSKGTIKMGFLVSFKNIKQKKKVSTKSLEVEVKNEHTLEDMTYIGFEIFENQESILSGSLIIALQSM